MNNTINIDAATLGKATGLTFKFGALLVGGGSTTIKEGANKVLGSVFGQKLNGDTISGLLQGNGDSLDYLKEEFVSVYKGEKSVTLTNEEIKECHRLARVAWEADKSGKNLYALQLEFKQAAKASKSTVK